MSRWLAIVLAFFAPLLCCAASLAVDDPWADAVLAHNAISPSAGFTDTSKALGAPAGGGVYAPNNTKAYCIGQPGAAPGSFITLKFNTPVADDPANPMGLDFVVHGNAFWAGGDPARRWAEPALVEISEDVNGNGLPDDPWCVIPGSRTLSASILPGGIPNPTPALGGVTVNTNTNGVERDWGYGDLSPTIQPYRDNYLRPDDPHQMGITQNAGGGDAFDIAWAVKSDGAPAGLTRFHFIRLGALISGSVSGFGPIAPEVSAVVDLEPDVDSDKDGILDAYETRVSGTDPDRPESTVLPLEIPAEFGGSPVGTVLGQAKDAHGNSIELRSRGGRTGVRAHNSNVDITPHTSPSPETPGKIKSGACREFLCDAAPFAGAQLDDARFTLAYTAANIAGLNESALEVYRLDGAAWSQTGIHDVQRDTTENAVHFSATDAGVFLLASVAGTGDTNPARIPITLTATPATGAVADGKTTVTITSDPIIDAVPPIPEGTVLQVSIAPETLAISLDDADPGQPGVQVVFTQGQIAFTMQSTTLAGLVHLRVASEDGVVAGELDYRFLSGPPAEPAELWVMNAQATAPGPIPFGTSEIRDAHGNLVDDGTLLTLVVSGGYPVGNDAAPGLSGFQIRTVGGTATFSITTGGNKANGTRLLEVAIYAEPTETTLLALGTFTFEYIHVPGPGPWLMLAAFGVAFLWVAVRQARQAKQDSFPDNH